MNSEARISYYDSAKDVCPSREITIGEFCAMVHDGETAAGVERVRAAVTEAEKRIAKMRLPAVQLSGLVTTGKRAKAMEEGRFNHSGFLQLDVDGGGLNGRTPEEARALLAKSPHVLAAFISPSGQGAKALFRIMPCRTTGEHKAQFLAVGKHVSENYGLTIDPATKDPGRLCYLPSDPNCTWNGSVKEFVLPEPQEAPPQAAKPQVDTSPTGGFVIRGAAFPEPPVDGIHGWLPRAARWCEFNGLSEEEAVAKLYAYEGQLRRKYSHEEPEDACRVIYSTPSSIFAASDQAVGKVNLSKFTFTDSGNAERVHAYAGSNFRYVSESGQWILWDGHRWTPDTNGGMVRLFVSVMKLTGLDAFKCGDADLAKSISRHALKSMDTRNVTAGLKMLQSILHVSISVNDLDADPWMIGTADGMIDLRSGKPITPDRSKLITKMIGTAHDPAATCPTWERFLGTVTGGDTELIGYLQSAVGYTLTGSNREQCLFFLHGSGQNGKGVFSETIKRLIGAYGQTAPESLFTKDRNQSATNDIARLAGCRMAIAAELEEDACFAESRIKSLTGGDTITARFLHQEFFDFVPTHHFWISGNHKPTVKGSDLGIWRRIRLIPFAVRIAESEKDPDLADKLAAEMPGILNWALEGCLRWQRDGLRTPQCVTKATEEYRIEEDVIGQFLEECTVDEADSRTLMSSLYEAYQGWAIKAGMKYPLTVKNLNRKLDDRGLPRLKSGGGRFWLGISVI